MPSIRQKEIKKVSEEILEFLSKPTVKEKCLAEKFRSKGGIKQYMFICNYVQSWIGQNSITRKIYLVDSLCVLF